MANFSSRMYNLLYKCTTKPCSQAVIPGEPVFLCLYRSSHNMNIPLLQHATWDKYCISIMILWYIGSLKSVYQTPGYRALFMQYILNQLVFTEYNLLLLTIVRSIIYQYAWKLLRSQNVMTRCWYICTNIKYW